MSGTLFPMFLKLDKGRLEVDYWAVLSRHNLYLL